MQTASDKRTGAEIYVSLRGLWDRYVAALTPAMAYGLDAIDPAGRRSEHPEARQRHESRGYLRSAG